MAVGLKNSKLVFEFPEIHKDAVLEIDFHRTHRIPDDGHTHGLPPSLGYFSLRDVHEIDEARLPGGWKKRGGVVLPMWQSEAAWLSFRSASGYPFAVKIAVGKVNAVTGKPWSEELAFGKGQDFMEVPGQPWLDGICVGDGVVKQFVAMPLGKGYTVEGQVTGKEDVGGLQILVVPLRADAWERRKPRHSPLRGLGGGLSWESSMEAPSATFMETDFMCSQNAVLGASASVAGPVMRSMARAAPVQKSMGLGAGGRMTQKIYESHIPAEEWASAQSRCFVAIANAETWEEMTGLAPHGMPESWKSYTDKGGIAFEHDNGSGAVKGADVLKEVKSVKDFGEGIGEKPLPENQGVDPAKVKVKKYSGVLPASGAKVLANPEF